MIIKNSFQIEQGNRESVPLTSDAFPYVCITTDMDHYADHTIGWHWHTAYEIAYFPAGCVMVRTPEQEFVIEAGGAVFINTGTLHTYEALENGSVIHAQLFDMHFLSGALGSVFEEKYFLPLNHCAALQTWPVLPDTAGHREMLRAVLRAVELAGNESFAFEFDIRSELCVFWRGLLSDTEPVRAASPRRSTADADRLKLMLGYIQDHYREKINLEQISAAAGVSVRECTRCFRRCIETSPTAYLNRYRLRMACRMLRETGESVLTISEVCGFSSSGYFTKTFRSAMRCTPLEYRKQM